MYDKKLKHPRECHSTINLAKIEYSYNFLYQTLFAFIPEPQYMRMTDV